MLFPKEIVQKAVECLYLTSKKDNYNTANFTTKAKIEYGNDEDNTEYCAYINPVIQEISGGNLDGLEEYSYNGFNISKFIEIAPTYEERKVSVDISYSYKEHITSIVIMYDYFMLLVNIPNSNCRIFMPKQ